MALMITRNLPMTNYRLAVARFLYKIVSIFFERFNTVKRGGILFEIDMTEGIDLSIFLFGFFQKEVLKNKLYEVKEGDVIFDVGANIGFLTLNFAKSIGKSGRVYAFEPTDYAFTKLEKNIALNKDLAGRITREKCFLSSKSEEKSALRAYSSWKVDPASGEQVKHPVHGGAIMETASTPSFTLDSFVKEHAVHRIDLIKIDTDGHELNVLQGGLNTLAKFRPKVVFECGQYILKEKGCALQDFLTFFNSLNYKIYDVYSGKLVTAANAKKIVPLKSTTDLVALPT